VPESQFTLYRFGGGRGLYGRTQMFEARLEREFSVLRPPRRMITVFSSPAYAGSFVAHSVSVDMVGIVSAGQVVVTRDLESLVHHIPIVPWPAKLMRGRTRPVSCHVDVATKRETARRGVSIASFSAQPSQSELNCPQRSKRSIELSRSRMIAWHWRLFGNALCLLLALPYVFQRLFHAPIHMAFSLVVPPYRFKYLNGAVRVTS